AARGDAAGLRPLQARGSARGRQAGDHAPPGSEDERRRCTRRRGRARGARTGHAAGPDTLERLHLGSQSLAGSLRDPRRRVRPLSARDRRAHGPAPTMKRAALLAVLVLAGCGGSKAPQLAGVAVDPPARAPNFSLEDQSGRAVSVAEQRGRWVVVTFLYTHCPD